MTELASSVDQVPLDELEVLVVDCQATGASPTHGLSLIHI